MGKKEPEHSVSKRRRHEARRRGSRIGVARGLGSTVSSPSGSWQSPAAKRHSVHFWCEMRDLARLSRAIVNANLQKIANKLPSHFHARLIQRKISFSLSVSHLAILRSKLSPLLICGKVDPP